MTKRWRPLPDDAYHTDCEILLRVDGPRLTVYSGGGETVIDLPRNMHLCELVEVEDAQAVAMPDGVLSAIAVIEAAVSFGVPFDVWYAKLTVRHWLKQQP